MVQRIVMTMPDDAPIIRFPSEEEQQATLDEFAREMRRVKERKESVSPEKLQEALATISDYLKTGWSTGGGRRLRQFVWSLWNGFHLINLYDLSSGLDGRLTDAVIIVFHAAMVDALSEDQKRRVLEGIGRVRPMGTGWGRDTRRRGSLVSAISDEHRGASPAGAFRRTERQAHRQAAPRRAGPRGER